jgi:hypothetical protein
MHFAKSEASAALIKGWKSVELCQAYILMAVYCPPARRWEEDRGWIFTGLAIRVAMDLNMHLPARGKPQSERQAREALNKTRTWMICYNMDRSTGTQFGKPCTIKDEYIECHPPDFYASSPHNSAYDIHICAYNALLRIVGQMHTELYAGGVASLGINTHIDLQARIPQFAEKLARCYDEWYPIIEDRRIPGDSVCDMRTALWPLCVPRPLHVATPPLTRAPAACTATRSSSCTRSRSSRRTRAACSRATSRCSSSASTPRARR